MFPIQSSSIEITGILAFETQNAEFYCTSNTYRQKIEREAIMARAQKNLMLAQESKAASHPCCPRGYYHKYHDILYFILPSGRASRIKRVKIL